MSESDQPQAPLTATVAEPVRPSTTPLEHLEAGAVVGRYVVVERLGSGGMGVVYAAWDRDLERKLALKILRPDRAAGAGAQARLLREAQAMARLAHPNVIHVYDVGTVGEQVFVAMELVEGETLRGWLAREPRGWREIVGVFSQAGRGLAAAHRAGLVHRDFKPDNAMVGEDGRVRVLDFGLARRAVGGEEERPLAEPRETASSFETPLTLTGAVLGTPAYMSPEQYRGGAADSRSDQFSFATALYEALYGRHPFDAPSAAAVRKKILAGRAGEPPAGASVPGWLRKALARALAADPAARHPSLDAFLGALAADPAARRRRWLGAAAALALAAVAAALLVRDSRRCSGGEARLAQVWNAERRAAGERAFAASGRAYAGAAWQAVAARLDAYGEAWAGMHREACEATRVRGDQSAELLDLRMGCLERRRVQYAALIDRLAGSHGEVGEEVVNGALEAASRLPGLAECANAEVLRARVRPPAGQTEQARLAALDKQLATAEAIGDTGDYEQSLSLAREAVAGAAEVGYPPLAARAHLAAGEALEGLGRYQDSEASLREALVSAEAGGDDPVRVRAALRLAWVAGYYGGKPQEAGPWIRLAEAALQRSGGDPQLDALLARGLAVRFSEQGRWAEAMEQGQRALPKVEAAFGPESYEAAEVTNNLGLAFHQLGRYEEALAHYEKALGLYRRLYGDEHPAVAEVMANIEGVHWKQGKHEQALAEALEVLALRRRILPADHADIAASLNDVAQPLQNLGRFAESIAYQEQALAALERTLGPDHFRVGGYLNNIAAAYRKMGRLAEAEATYRRALAILEKNLGRDNPMLAYPWTGLGLTLLDLKRPADAVEPLELAWQVRGEGKAIPKERGNSAFNLARALAESGGDRGRARELALRALALYSEAGESAKTEREKVEAWMRERGW